jgi:hypothetical protein
VRFQRQVGRPAGSIFTTKHTKDTKFRFNSKDLREARASFFVPFLVSLVSLVVKKGFGRDR